MILGCFLEHKDTEENCSPNQSEISVIHKPLLAKRKKKDNHATAGSAAFCFFLKIKKKPETSRWLLFSTKPCDLSTGFALKHRAI